MPGTTNRYRNLRPGGRPFRVIPSFRALFQHRNGLFGLASRSGPFRNGNTHTYSYDTLSRPIADAVTTLGSGVDGTVRRITTGYSPLNTSYLFTSYDAASGGNVVNQVKDEFNGLGQVTKEWQEHSGAVTGTSANVQYAYSEMACGANHSRLTSITYASGYVLNYNYGTGLDSNISRLTSLSDSGNTLESYSYLGLATIVKRAHPQSGVDLSYIKLSGESVGDAGDQYTGLDRFQRIVDQRWINGSNVDVDRYKYGMDRDGNRLFKENVVLASLSEVYTYDDLNQIATYKLGTLNTGKTDVTGTPTNAQGWDYDAVGNWDSVTTNSTTQTRGANRQNEITSVSGATTPTYDSNGNLTKDENDNRFVWDAWNMMVQVKNSSNVVIVTYGRDALHRHVTDTVGTSVTDRFFSQAWQLLETKAGANTVTRNVWSPAYVDAMVLRDRDTDSNGTLDERLFALQDANWNTTGLVNTSGTVLERDTFGPYGGVTFRDGYGSGISTSARDWVFLHQGGEKIAAGDYEFRNRVYSPTLGRWLSNDPIGFDAEDVNIYRYEENEPEARTDQNGFKSCGPDVTDWFLIEIAKFRNAAIKARRRYENKMRSIDATMDFSMQGTESQRLIITFEMALEFRRLSRLADYKARNKPGYEKRAEPFDFSKCDDPEKNTVTICGVCVGTNQLGNLMFGILATNFRKTSDAREYGYGKSLMNRMFGMKQKVPWDLPGEMYRAFAFEAGIDFENDYKRTGKYNICEIIKERGQILGGPNAKDKTPCIEKHCGPNTDMRREPINDGGGN